MVSQVVRWRGCCSSLDSVELRPPFATVRHFTGNRRSEQRRCRLLANDITEVAGIPCTIGLRTLVDLANEMTDIKWEHALESALRQNLVTIEELAMEVERIRPQRIAGVRRIRRVLKLRPEGAPPTGSILETLMVQLIRTDSSLPTPERQVEVLNRHGDFVAYVDLAWPDLGIFIELDGRKYHQSGLYDARRETAVVAAKRLVTRSLHLARSNATPKLNLASVARVAPALTE